MFRGIRKDNGEWIEGWLVKARVLKDGTYDRPIKFCIITYFPDMRENTIGVKRITGGIVEVHPNSVAMQAGVLDKNKNMIYGSIKLDGKMTRGGDEVQVKHTTSISDLSGLDSLTEVDVEQTWNGPVLWDIGTASFILIENDVRVSKLLSIYEYEIIGSQWKDNHGKT